MESFKVGDRFALPVEVTNVDPNTGQLEIKILERYNPTADADDQHSYSEFYIDGVDQHGARSPAGGTYTVLEAQKSFKDEPLVAGDIVNTIGEPQNIGQLATVYKGQGLIDWAFETPDSPAALSQLPISRLQRNTGQ